MILVLNTTFNRIFLKILKLSNLRQTYDLTPEVLRRGFTVTKIISLPLKLKDNFI
jgi:hypothetical protein